jgi:hypothetical protein
VRLVPRLLACHVLAVTSLFSSFAEGSVRKVVLSGDQVPGAGGAQLELLANAVFSRGGFVAIFGKLGGAYVDDATSLAIWSGHADDALRLIAREGDPASTSGTGSLNRIDFNSYTGDSLRVNNAGKIAFFGYDKGEAIDSTSNELIWTADFNGSVTQVARTGDAAPGTNGKAFRSLAPQYSGPFVELNNAGEVAFVGRLSFDHEVFDPGDKGIWSDRGGTMELIVRVGDNVPNATGATYSDIYDVQLNDVGNIAFGGEFVEAGYTLDRDFGLWSSDRTLGMRMVYRRGDLIDGSSGRQISGTFDSTLTALGQVAMIPGFDGPDSSAQGVWIEHPGVGLQKVLTPSDFTRSGERVGSFKNCCLTTNDVGGVGFTTDQGGNWAMTVDGDIRQVADTGMSAPGLPNTTFDNMNSPKLNNHGKAAFETILRTRTFTPGHTEPAVSIADSIWAETVSGELKPIFTQGDVIDVEDGPSVDLRTVQRLALLGIDDRGRVAALLFFTDHSRGVFISDVAAIPEPVAIVEIALALLGMVLTKRTLKTRDG